MDKILLIAPCYFSYYKIIKDRLTKMGYQVDWLDDRPSTNIFMKSLLRLNKNILKRKINKYSNKINKLIHEGQYNFCLIILGQSFSKEDINKWKTSCPTCKFIFYSWDSIKNFPNIIELANKCDVAFSFDSEDAKQFNNIKFLPLFYSYRYEIKEKEFDFSYVGTIKLGKYKYIKAIISELSNTYNKSFIYLYMQSPLVLLYYKIRFKEFRKAKFKEFKYKKLSYEDTLNIYARSKFVIDCQMQNQNGLTMRTFETLALNSKLITTNSKIKEYEFYSPNNVYIYENNFDFDNKFFKTNFVNDKEFLKKYNIDSFLEQLIMEEK